MPAGDGLPEAQRGEEHNEDRDRGRDDRADRGGSPSDAEGLRDLPHTNAEQPQRRHLGESAERYSPPPEGEKKKERNRDPEARRREGHRRHRFEAQLGDGDG